MDLRIGRWLEARRRSVSYKYLKYILAVWLQKITTEYQSRERYTIICIIWVQKQKKNQSS